jgi:hypothetical protein
MDMTTTNPPATGLAPTNPQQPKPDPKGTPEWSAGKPTTPMALSQRGTAMLHTMEEALRFADAVVKSGLAPKGDTRDTVLIKLQAGAELGFPPMRALASLVVVNGRLAMQGDAMLALIRASGKARVIVGVEGSEGNRIGYCDIERFDTKEKDRITFSWADAKRAGLAGKDTYKNYGDDMLIWKAVARAGRRYFSDILAGMESAEEVKTWEATPYTPVTVQPSNARQLTAPPSGDDPLMVEPSAAETVPAQPEQPAEPCTHPGLGAGYLDNMPEDEIAVCQGCGEEIKGPGKNVKAKAEKAAAAKGQGRLA